MKSINLFILVFLLTGCNLNLPSKKNDSVVIDIYAFNDLHGRISENDNEPGISKLSSFLKNKKSENENTIIINSGDYWQDTYESGYNKGKLLSECLDEIGVDTFTLGNHEFDWGIDVIKENKKLSTYTTYLGANIVNYSSNEIVDFVEPYKIIEKDDVKIGVVGAIGRKQLTSITSSNWEDITFLDHKDIVKDLSDELRVEKGCDVVLLSIHADEEDTYPFEISEVSPVSKEKYFDAVFCAHSHQKETRYYNDVPFVQAGSHGNYLDHVTIEIDKDGNKVVSNESISSFSIEKCNEDNEIENIKNKYFTEAYLDEKDEIIGTVNASYISSELCGRILAKATYERLKENNIEVDIVINNGARQSGDAGKMTREKIFNLIPFTNKTIVAKEIKGEDIIKECVTYPNPYYMNDSSLKIESNKYYTVACIDYMMLHKNVYRDYDYFKSFNKNKVIYTIDDYCNKIVEDYLLEKEVINYNDFLTSNFTCL